ncbi:MAG: class II fructose-bisphosphate aldolase [Evtepia sp.]
MEYAHQHGVVVEGELGRLAGIEDDVNVSAADSSYTDPNQVEEFVRATGVDSLAIAIGTSHGAFKFKPGTKPQLRFDILEEVGRRLPGFPIVLHGASSVIPRVRGHHQRQRRPADRTPSVCRRISCARPPSSPSARSTSTLTSAWP